MDHRGRVLFVDDDAPVRTAFARSLRSCGVEVELADGFERAAELLEKGEYAVVATDYRMPRVNGLELVERLREGLPDTVFVLVSGECDLDLALAAVNAHAVSHVVCKPWDTDELATLLKRSIEVYWEKAGLRQVQRRVVETTRELAANKERLVEAMATTESNMSEVLLNSLELRGHENKAHCKRVARYSLLIARRMGISEEELKGIEQGALLHDVGKIGIPDAILLKPGPLTEEEWVIMRRHTSLGARLLEGFAELAVAREIVSQHHERWDGTGYPESLEAEQICLGARIFAVADAFEALLSKRPYREGGTAGDAIEEILRCAGTQFDPEVVACFASIDELEWAEARKDTEWFPSEGDQGEKRDQDNPHS